MGEYMENPTPETTPKSNLVMDTENSISICYFLYLASFVFGITSIVGLIIAYVKKPDADEYWMQSHYTYLIRTFWITLLYSFIGLLLIFVLVGIPVLIASMILFLVRTIVGLNLFFKKQEIPNPQSWLV